MLEKTIYITGYGRSGSTILDMILGQHPQVFGAGEMSTICRHVWPNDEFCACGARVRSCTFWSPILAAWQRTGIRPADHARLQQRVEPILSPARLAGHRVARDYVDQTLALFRLVADAAGCPVVLDSSKSPGRAFAMAASDCDLRVIHLVRDPRAVAYSMSKPMDIDVTQGVQKRIRANPAARTALRWSYVNAGAERIVRRLGPERAIRVRYEDLVVSPQHVLERIGPVVGIDLAPLGAQIGSGAKIAAQHQVAGSRIRMSGPMTLRPDMGWHDRMSEKDRQLVRHICWRRMRAYGYEDLPGPKSR